MKTIQLSIIMIAFLLSNQLIAQDIISATDLAKQTNVVIVSARTAEDYEKVHITNAVHINHKDLYKAGAVEGLLKTSGEIATLLGSKGISQTSKIVVYDDGSWKYAGRLYWIFKYMGVQDVKILNGGIDAWKAARKPVTKNPTTIKAVTFTPAVQSGILASMTDVKSGSYLVVDVRPATEYSGAEGTTSRLGHIPGAINFNYETLMNADKTLKTNAEIQALVNAAGITQSKQIILYCNTSVRAGVVYMALKGLGYSNLKVYDGGFNEWVSVSTNVVQ